MNSADVALAAMVAVAADIEAGKTSALDPDRELIAEAMSLLAILGEQEDAN